MIPAYVIACVSGLAGAAWIVFARSQRGRMQSSALGWLCIPFFQVALVYLWFSLTDVPIDLRGMHARIMLFSVSVSQAVILFILSYLQRGTPHGRQ